MQGYDNLRDAIEDTGYDEENWNSGCHATNDLDWAELTSSQQQAWSVLGFNQSSWDTCPGNAPTCPVSSRVFMNGGGSTGEVRWRLVCNDSQIVGEDYGRSPYD